MKITKKHKFSDDSLLGDTKVILAFSEGVSRGLPFDFFDFSQSLPVCKATDGKEYKTEAFSAEISLSFLVEVLELILIMTQIFCFKWHSKCALKQNELDILDTDCS